MPTLTGLDVGREKLLGRVVVRHVMDYLLESPERRKEFEEWYLKTYHEPYVWK